MANQTSMYLACSLSAKTTLSALGNVVLYQQRKARKPKCQYSILAFIHVCINLFRLSIFNTAPTEDGMHGQYPISVSNPNSFQKTMGPASSAINA
ncbi:hypothetical protein V6N12_005961 [Hibiscus sabdariffa]|uniref:Uncharacterized protein n=1 Tax=Hibiscus sabdariffa TaxID=183260 RepID=A0ABR2EXQ9_9ROSI